MFNTSLGNSSPSLPQSYEDQASFLISPTSPDGSKRLKRVAFADDAHSYRVVPEDPLRGCFSSSLLLTGSARRREPTRARPEESSQPIERRVHWRDGWDRNRLGKDPIDKPIRHQFVPGTTYHSRKEAYNRHKQALEDVKIYNREDPITIPVDGGPISHLIKPALKKP